MNCIKCGKKLGENPAETYPGTYTGLCYNCQDADPYIVEEFPDSGVKISYPPYAPSFRRERRTFVAYRDCCECRGSGRIKVQRDLTEGGSYFIQCRACSKRYYNYPPRRDNIEFGLTVAEWVEDYLLEFMDKVLKDEVI